MCLSPKWSQMIPFNVHFWYFFSPCTLHARNNLFLLIVLVSLVLISHGNSV